jgi:ATP-dependent Clp protease, protease subunit
MKLKLIVGLVVLAATAIFPLSSLSKGDALKEESVTLTSNNTIVLNSEVNGESVSEVIAKAKDLDNKLSGLREKVGPKRPLYLFIYSPGGSIQSGLELIEALNGLGRPVNTITLFSASMAFQLVQNLGDRLILKNGVLMSHHAAGQSEGEFGGSGKSQMDNRNQLWLDRVKEMDEQTVKRTNGKQTYESYTKQYDHEMWLTGTRSVDEGYADKIVTIKCDSSLAGATTHHINFLGLDISYDLDNCPINTSPMNVKVAAPEGKVIISTDSLVAEVKSKFLAEYKDKHERVIPMYW